MSNIDDRVTGYIYQLKNWGWINCDYFSRVPKKQLATVKINLPLDANAKLVMTGNKKSILRIQNNFESPFVKQQIDR